MKILNNNRNIAFVIAAIINFGCSTAPYSPVKVSQMGPNELKSVPDRELCKAYSYKNSDYIWQEIGSRRLVKASRRVIDESELVLEIGSCELLAYPNFYCSKKFGVKEAKANGVVTEKAVWICGRFDVHTLNGIVIKITDSNTDRAVMKGLKSTLNN